MKRANETMGTPNRDDQDESAVPRFPIMSPMEPFDDQTSDDTTLNSDHQSDVELADLVEVAVDLGTTNADNAFGNGSTSQLRHSGSCGSLHSDKSFNTASTSISQSLDNAEEEGTSFVLEIKAPQQHTRTGGYARLSSKFASFDSLRIPEPGPILLLGVDISHLSPKVQFIVCASGVFGFSLLYGYLQELISVQIFNRQLGLFLSVVQFTGYTVLSYILKSHVNRSQEKNHKQRNKNAKIAEIGAVLAVPFVTYLGLSLLRAVDLAMTNLAMQYINYPAKTLMKSSRVIFTMVFGVLILRKKYLFMDYLIVLFMVVGLGIFMYADATSSAVFQPLGVIMLTISLLCDGAITNMGESIMTKYGVGQDEFIFRMYSIALVAITAAAAVKGDLQVGMAWMLQPGTYDEVQQGVPPELASWSVTGKMGVLFLFSSMGLLSSSCSAAITKHFGALAMSITSTARKATTVFLSFFLFNNVCTMEHIAGVAIFIAALTAKSLRRKNKGTSSLSSSASSIPDTAPTSQESTAVMDLLYRRLKQGDSRSFPPASTEGTPSRPARRSVRGPGSFVDSESQHRFVPETFHLTRPTERSTPNRYSSIVTQVPSCASGLDHAVDYFCSD